MDLFFQELIPLILCTASLHPDPKERDQLLNILFNLIKRPDQDQRWLFWWNFIFYLIIMCENCLKSIIPGMTMIVIITFAAEQILLSIYHLCNYFNRISYHLCTIWFQISFNKIKRKSPVSCMCLYTAWSISFSTKMTPFRLQRTKMRPYVCVLVRLLWLIWYLNLYSYQKMFSLVFNYTKFQTSILKA